ncbi:MAG: hypothetical protein IIB03_09815 [Acidobacteria bacterium]|nr:hypothetical protein [Acidobacteriota bacterium]
MRLRYRTVGNRVWSYAYPAFESGQRVTATFNLSAVGGDFLPLGAQLEYYYVIRDDQGGVYETPSKTLEYTDTRFQWQQAQAGPLILMYHDIPRSKVAEVTSQVEVELRRLASMLRLDTSRPIKGIIYNERSAAVDAFPRQSRTITDQHVFEGFAFPERGMFVGLGMSPRLIVHESAHVMLHQTLRSGAARVPAWLDEGFASYMEPGANPYSGQSLSSIGLPLTSMTAVHGTCREIRDFYRKSESVVAYLIESHGADRFRGLLDRLKEGRQMEEGLLMTYGFGVAGLEEVWSTDSRGRHAPARIIGARPSPFVYFDVWLISLLALLALAAALVRYTAGRFQSNLDPEEGLQPWEDPDVLDRERDRDDSF